MLRVTKGRNGWGSLLSTLTVILVFGVPAFIIATVGANEALNAAHYLSRRSAEEGGFTSFATSILQGPVHYVGHWIDLSKYDLHAIITSNAQKVSLGMVGFGAAILGNLARFTIDSLITFVILFFLFREGKDWAYRAGRITPLSDVQVARLYQQHLRHDHRQRLRHPDGRRGAGHPHRHRDEDRGHAFVAAAGNGCGLRVDHSGCGLRAGVGPVAIYLFVQGAIWKGVFLLVWGTVVVSSVDNVIRPWVVGGRVELHPMVLVFFILGGVEAFGFLGLFLGPVVASVLAAVFAMLREEVGDSSSGSARSIDDCFRATE